VIFAFISLFFVFIIFASFFKASRFRKRTHELFSSTLKKRSELTNDHCDYTLSSK
jgi:ABC-type multidrug transport system permease subunit